MLQMKRPEGSAPSLDKLSRTKCEVCTLSPTQFVLEQSAVPQPDSAGTLSVGEEVWRPMGRHEEVRLWRMMNQPLAHRGSLREMTDEHVSCKQMGSSGPDVCT
ncbi:hypothetical protein SRHO_G00184880 [Serrasalmus rhombeus]